MEKVKEQLKNIFEKLNRRIDEINRERRNEGLLSLPRAKVQILGQMSLLFHDRVSMILSLAQTADIDAFLTMDHKIKSELKKFLIEVGLIYDEDSYLIWIPPGAKFETTFEFDHVLIESLDPESTLVSKAIKAPKKNKLLLREAIASEEFPGLVDRILENGGKLEDFV